MRQLGMVTVDSQQAAVISGNLVPAVTGDGPRWCCCTPVAANSPLVGSLWCSAVVLCERDVGSMSW